MRRVVMFHSVLTQKKWMAQRLSPPGLELAEEKHEQKNDCAFQLLVAQLKLECQFQHGESPVYAGSAANWLKVGFGGYEEPLAVSERILCHLTAWLPPRRGLPGRGCCRHPGPGSQFLKHNE